jgi:hypothetical protein
LKFEDEEAVLPSDNKTINVCSDDYVINEGAYEKYSYKKISIFDKNFFIQIACSMWRFCKRNNIEPLRKHVTSGHANMYRNYEVMLITRG